MNIKRVVCWYSCGVTSAVATKLAIDKYRNIYPVVIVYCDTGSEHDDNLRFVKDCEVWYDQSINILKNPKYIDTYDVYKKENFIVNRFGARCSLELKKKVRQSFEDLNGDLQVFGFDFNETKRTKRFQTNNPEVFVEFPLIDAKITKADCINIITQNGIVLPIAYTLGFKNNNCLKTGCVKGGSGYWNFYRQYNPEGFKKMAEISRKIGCKLIMKAGKHIYLDELDPSSGNYKSELPIQCGLFCGEL